MRRMWVMLIQAACIGAMAAGSVHAEGTWPGVDDPARARVNYMLNCQGCHGAEGLGTADGSVPVMKDFVGRFLLLPQGREFLVRVPGSANAALTDQRLAEVLNWMLPQISRAQIPADFVPYSAAEVARLRARPLADVNAERDRLLGQLDRVLARTNSANPG